MVSVAGIAPLDSGDSFLEGGPNGKDSGETYLFDSYISCVNDTVPRWSEPSPSPGCHTLSVVFMAQRDEQGIPQGHQDSLKAAGGLARRHGIAARQRRRTNAEQVS